MTNTTDLLQADPSSKLSKRALADYVSRLNRVPEDLGIEPKKFYKISNSKKLSALKIKLIANKKFNKRPTGTQENIIVAFNRYFKIIKKIEELNVLSKKHLKHLNLSLKKRISESKSQSKMIKKLLHEIELIFNEREPSKKMTNDLMEYIGVSDSRELKKIFITNQKLNNGNYYRLVFDNTTDLAKVLALRSHSYSLGIYQLGQI